MRLYSRFGATQVSNEDFGDFDVDPDSGAVEVPPALGALLHNQHINGLRAWEDDAERTARLTAEELARRKDPATLLAAVEELAGRVVGRAPEPELQATSPGFGQPVTGISHPANGTVSPPVENAPAATKAPAKKAPAKRAPAKKAAPKAAAAE